MVKETQSSQRPYWICVIITSVSAVVSAGFSVAALLNRSEGDVYASYAAARSLPVAVVALGLLRYRSSPALLALALTMTLIQVCDAIIGVFSHDIGKTIGPLVLASATLVSLLPVLRTSRGSS